MIKQITRGKVFEAQGIIVPETQACKGLANAGSREAVAGGQGTRPVGVT